jgi:opacity protein-like surface antigen
MKKLLFLLYFSPFVLQAQNFHFSARAGIANYQGDLQAKKFTLKQGKFLWALGANYDLTEHITARTYFSFTALQADDKKGTASMKQRNLNFATKVFAWELGAQYNFLSLNNSWWTPYVFAGIGIFHFKPYTHQVDGTKTYLQPLSTEGQGFDGVKPYKYTQLSIPLGIGAQYAINEDIRVGLELGYHKLFTDYLDDVSSSYVDEAALFSARGQTAVDLAYRGDEVGGGPYPAAKSQRGNAKDKDGMYYIAITLTVRSFIDQYKRIAGLPAYKHDKKVGCPANRLN